ncbi:hypothetical protein JHK86_047703 [Glycine max]|nr:hypothetical protein JHK86_047703 [Glycine max]
MRERALTAQHSSMITISKFEYDYLTNHVALAEEIADKKVAATEAWIEALKASEKEILMETKIAQKELKESKLEQELEVYTKEKMLSRRSIKLNGTITPARGAKFQKTTSPAARHINPFTIKKRKKAKVKPQHSEKSNNKSHMNLIPNAYQLSFHATFILSTLSPLSEYGNNPRA